MLDTDRWFHDQLGRLQGRQAALHVAGPRRRRWRMAVAGLVLVVVLGVFAGEAALGPMRADQPFGLTPSPAAFQAAALPSINGKGSTAAKGDRRTVVVAGVRP